MTRGRHTNTAYLYERIVPDSEYGHQRRGRFHVTPRGGSRYAADIIRAVLASPDPTPGSAHDYATRTPAAALPDRVQSLLNRRATAKRSRRAVYETWRTEAKHDAQSLSRARGRAHSRDRGPDRGIEL